MIGFRIRYLSNICIFLCVSFSSSSSSMQWCERVYFCNKEVSDKQTGMDAVFSCFFFNPADSRGITSREVYRVFQPSLTSPAGPVPRVDQTTGSVHGPSLHCPIANSASTQSQTTSIGRLIKSSQLLRVNNSTQATFEQFPIQVLIELNVAWLQWSYENWYFQVDKPLRPHITNLGRK